MTPIKTVRIDPDGAFPELCAALLARGGFAVVDAEAGAAPGGCVPVVRGLVAETAASFGYEDGRTEPLIAVVRVEDLQDEAVVAAAGSAHAYCLVGDGDAVVKATVLAAYKRWQIERRLHESEARFRFMAENAGDVIWILDVERGAFSYISPSIERLRGLSVEAAMAERMEDSLSPDSLAKARAQLAERYALYMETGVAHPITDIYEQRHGDGGMRFVEITTTLRAGPDGRGIEVLGVSRDVSERVATERSLRATLAERDILLQELGHRIKNTLSLTGSLISLAGSRAVNTQDAELFEESKARVQAMALLYDMLLSSGSTATVAVAPYIKALCDKIGAAFAPSRVGEAIELRLEGEGRGAELDSSRAVALGLILNEALTNAFKYAAGPGRAASVRVSLREGEDRIELRIVDDGPGLPAGAEAGDGLGLRLIRELVAQLKGRLRVESSERGLSLVLDLPR